MYYWNVNANGFAYFILAFKLNLPDHCHSPTQVKWQCNFIPLPEEADLQYATRRFIQKERGRQPKWNTTQIENYQMEENQSGRQSKCKTTKMDYDQNGRLIFGSKLTDWWTNEWNLLGDRDLSGGDQPLSTN